MVPVQLLWSAGLPPKCCMHAECHYALPVCWLPACRESARRMRAKRSEAAQHLETSVNLLTDRNKQLEQQNRDYAKALEQLQAEMHSLRNQLLAKQGVAALPNTECQVIAVAILCLVW